MRRPAARFTATALTVLLAFATTTACSSDPGGGKQDRIRLTLGTFGNSGYAELIKQYERTHPNIDVVERVTEYNAHHQTLAVQLASGQGANDVESVEEGYMTQFRAQADKFVNLLEHGAADRQSRSLDWKWKQSLSSDGKAQIGLGTDVGGLAMCYRRDLFQKAGLPTDRAAVSKLWPDWSSYFAVGQRFEAADVGSNWYDSASNVYNAMVAQLPISYYDQDNEVVVKDQPAVQKAFDTTARSVVAGQSAGLGAFSPQWGTGFQKGTFATVTCPAWMMGYIKNAAPQTAGKWDIAAVPGGGGNWGGSFLTVPKQTKHPQEAYQLARWLTDQEQQLAVFKATGNFPADPALYESPELSGFSDPFFGNAPVGRIFGESAKVLEPQYLGPKHGAVRVAFEKALTRVEQRKQEPGPAWDQALSDAGRAVTK